MLAKQALHLVSLLTAVVVLASSSACSIPSRTEPPSSTEETATPGDEAPSAEATPPASRALQLKIGETASYDDAADVTVLAATRGPADMAGGPTFKISVRYDNKSTESVAYNELDWQIEDVEGARTNEPALLEQPVPTLGSGDLAPGGTKQGDVYFASNSRVVKVVYTATIFGNEENRATWAVTPPDAEQSYEAAQSIDRRINAMADRINGEIGSASTVSADTLAECASLRSDTQNALSDARGLTDPRGKLLVQVLELHLDRALALLEGAEAAQAGTDYSAAFSRGRRAKIALGWVPTGEGEYRLDPNGLQARLDAAFQR